MTRTYVVKRTEEFHCNWCGTPVYAGEMAMLTRHDDAVCSKQCKSKQEEERRRQEEDNRE